MLMLKSLEEKKKSVSNVAKMISSIAIIEVWSVQFLWVFAV